MSKYNKLDLSLETDVALPTVVIIGRPNVGKSSLFNRLVGRRRSLVHDEPGVTRDRIEEESVWILRGNRYGFRVIDTGGLGHERFAEEIRRQVETALACAQAVVMVFDGQAGLLPEDREVLRSLRVAGMFDRDQVRTPVIAVVNKVDTDAHEDDMLAQFYEAGLEHVVGVSAEHNRGVDDLQLLVLEEMEKAGTELALLPDEAVETRRVPRITIIGKPNVGKSTLVNALLGEERMVTSPIAGTTVDSVDSRVELDGYPFILADTAGIRRKDRTEQGVEVLSVVKARQALEGCDVAILVIDGEFGSADQDEKIGSLIEEVGCGVILAVNKWDTMQGKGFTKEQAAKRIRESMAYLRYAPIVFMSARRGEGLDGLGELAQEILNQRQLRISTRELTEWIRKAAEIHNPADAKFYLTHQVAKNPPSFVCHVSDPDKVHFSLRRNLVNNMREKWGFMGSPVRLSFHLAQHRRGPKVRKKYDNARRNASKEMAADGG